MKSTGMATVEAKRGSLLLGLGLPVEATLEISRLQLLPYYCSISTQGSAVTARPRPPTFETSQSAGPEQP